MHWDTEGAGHGALLSWDCNLSSFFVNKYCKWVEKTWDDLVVVRVWWCSFARVFPSGNSKELKPSASFCPASGRFFTTIHEKQFNTPVYLTDLLHLKHHALPVWSCHNYLQMVLIKQSQHWAPFPPLSWPPHTLHLAPLWEGILEIPYP